MSNPRRIAVLLVLVAVGVMFLLMVTRRSTLTTVLSRGSQERFRGDSSIYPSSTPTIVTTNKQSSPNVVDMYKRLVTVSAISDNHFVEAQEILVSVQRCLPHKGKNFRFEGHLAGDFHFGPQTPENSLPRHRYTKYSVFQREFYSWHSEERQPGLVEAAQARKVVKPPRITCDLRSRNSARLEDLWRASTELKNKFTSAVYKAVLGVEKGHR